MEVKDEVLAETEEQQQNAENTTDNSNTRKDPRNREGFTPAEDGLITWFFFNEPITNYKKITQILFDKPFSVLAQRFQEIINSPELLQRVKKEINNDIINFKPTTSTIFEDYYYLKAKEILKPKESDEIFYSYPFFFHPSRNSTFLKSADERLAKKFITNSEDAKAVIDQFRQKIREEIGDMPLEAFPGGFEDPVAEVSKYLGEAAAPDPEPVLESIDFNVKE